MSLLDALLLDPQRIDLWAAVRKDGIFGSGTQTDPYDISPRLDVKKAISGFTPNGTEAVATCSAHGYSNNDVVVISGASDPAYNGSFVIYGVVVNTSCNFLGILWSGWAKLRRDPGVGATPAEVVGGDWSGDGGEARFQR